MTKTRPAVLHVVLGLEVGGLERFVCDLANESLSMVQPFVACLEQNGPMGASLPSNIPVFELHKRPGIRLEVVGQLADIVRRHDIDVIHTHNQSPHFYGAFAGLLTNRPVVHTKHGRNRPGIYKKVLLSRISSCLTHKIVTVSSDAADVCTKIEKVEAAKVVTILNGINTKNFYPSRSTTLRDELRLPPAEPIIGIVARLAADKDHATLLDACGLLFQRGLCFTLVIIGDGPLRAFLQNKVRDEGYGDKIRFLGTRLDIPNLISQLDLFVLSSITEGISLTLLEAMCSQIPIVATDVGGNREVVEDGVTGFIVPAKSPERLSEKMKVLLDNRALRIAMGEAGRRRVIENFSLTKAVSEYVSLYQQVLCPRQ